MNQSPEVINTRNFFSGRRLLKLLELTNNTLYNDK